ncbi:hypothetical protein [Burkholderia glumae]|uniref:DUF7940 domain-containing protein n=1 Tax=Burkholderia glumae TaxID=337 RepID=UPI0002D9E07C|nr:hypothetical protein [Burkholderia glumae]UVS95634.1 hypothetical protein EFP19_07540 [Burkholderia glumae]
MKQIELIEDWKRAWRLYSVHAMLIAAVLGIVEAGLAAAHIAWLPEWVFGALTALIAVSGIVGRIVKQDPGDAARIADLKQ